MLDAAASAVRGRAESVRRLGLWALWFGALFVAAGAMLLVRSRLDEAHISLVFLLVVLGGSAAGGRALGLSLAFAAFLAFNYFFLPPYLTLVIANPLDWLVLVTFLITSIVAAQLLYRATATAEAATQRAAEVDRLATLGAETLNLRRPEDALGAILDVIRTTLGVSWCDIFVRRADGGFERIAHSSDDEPGAAPDAIAPGANAQGLVGWIFAHGTRAVELVDGTVRLVDDPGRDAAQASAIGDVRALSIPLTVRGETVGVLRVRARGELVLTHEQARFLDALAYYAALGVERGRLVAEAERAEAERRAESLRSALLTAVSHDLRTPLTTIKAISHEIAEGAPGERAHVIEEEADRLDGLVGDLLDLSRIHAGAVRPVLEVNTVDDLIGAALRRAGALLRARPVEVDVPQDELLTGRFDLANSVRVLVNLLENACKYAPAEAPILIGARREGAAIRVSVLDRGPGVSPTERERMFEPFYRPVGTPPDIHGTGLGLSIARGLAMAQGGTVEFTPRPGGGSCFTLVLPSADPLLPAEALADD